MSFDLPKLSEAQQAALDKLLAGVKAGESIQRLGGYAGTGKTVLMRYLYKHLGSLWGFCAFTGKAADMMRRKGISSSSTIHSLIYRRVEGAPPGKQWRLKTRGEVGVKGFAIDEGSMVSGQIFRDLVSFDLPIVVVGDHGQLPPVGEDAGVMKNPDITLEEIHRNAGSIAFFAEYLRKGGDPWLWDGPYESNGTSVELVSDIGRVTSYDQVLCAFIVTRNALNRKALIELDRKDTEPQIGDRVMVLQNNRDVGVFNGQQGKIEKFVGDLLSFRPSYSNETIWLVPDPRGWLAEKKLEYKRTHKVPLDYAWATTVHKAQGDEYDHVGVVEERCPLWEHSRWTYTAASRAKVKLSWRLLA